MAKNRIAYYTKEGRVSSQIISSTTATVFTSGAEGSKISAIYISGSTMTASSIRVFAFDGVNSHDIFTATTPSIGQDLLDATGLPKSPNGNRFFNVPANWEIKVTAVGGTAAITIYGEDY